MLWLSRPQSASLKCGTRKFGIHWKYVCSWSTLERLRGCNQPQRFLSFCGPKYPVFFKEKFHSNFLRPSTMLPVVGGVGTAVGVVHWLQLNSAYQQAENLFMRAAVAAVVLAVSAVKLGGHIRCVTDSSSMCAPVYDGAGTRPRVATWGCCQHAPRSTCPPCTNDGVIK